MLLKRVWVFLLIGAISVGGFIVKNTQRTAEEEFQVATKLLFIYERETLTPSALDNASKMQPVYDAVEILSSGDFLEGIVDELDFQTEVSMLRNAISVELIPITRVISVYVNYENPEQAMAIAEAVNDKVDTYFREIYKDIYVHILEHPQLPSLPVERATVRGGQQGIIVGMSLCIIVAMLLIILYICNDSIRTEQELRQLIELPYWGNYRDGIEEIVWNMEKITGEKKEILIISSIQGEGKSSVIKALNDMLLQAKKSVRCITVEEYEQNAFTEEYVLIEAPAFSQSLAGLRLADKMDSTILVVGANVAGYQSIHKSKELLLQTKCNHIATVFYNSKGAEKILKCKR